MQSPYGAFCLRLIVAYSPVGPGFCTRCNPLTGLFVCDTLGADPEFELVIALQSPYGAFCLRLSGLCAGAGAGARVAIPLRGFLFATRAPPPSCGAMAAALQSPYGAFCLRRLCLQCSRIWGASGVAIPLRGFLFATAYPVNRRPVKGS